MEENWMFLYSYVDDFFYRFLKSEKEEGDKEITEEDLKEALSESIRCVCMNFETPESAIRFSNNEKYVEKYLFHKNSSLKIDEIKDFSNGIIVMGIHNGNFDFDDDEEESSFTIEYWKKCFSLEEIEQFKNQKEISSEYPMYFFNPKDNSYEKYYSEYIKACKEYEDFIMRTVHFEGDIIITDPCYIRSREGEKYRPKYNNYYRFRTAKEYPDYDGKHSKMFENDSNEYNKAYKEWEEQYPDLCDLTNGYSDFSKLDFSEVLCRDTLYGDWSCHTYNSDTKEILGKFCADSGMVAVFLLDEVLKYNPNFDYHITKPWTTTLIKDFKGDVHFEIIDEETLIIKGKGNINFETNQTGF